MTDQEFQRRSSDGWHLDKKVPISIILTLLIYGISGLWFVADIKRDVEVLKAQQILQHAREAEAMAQQRDRDERQDRSVSEALAQVRDAVREGNAKLDRLIERMGNHTAGGAR